MSTTELGIVLCLLYGLGGVMTGGWLVRQGQPARQVVAALVVWPFLLQSTTPGPYTERIIGNFQALEAALQEPGAPVVLAPAAVAALKDSLLKADARLGRVDRMLGDLGAAGEPLRQARARAAGEIEAVLDALLQVRVQLGLWALSGDTLPIQARIGELTDRVRALEELA